MAQGFDGSRYRVRTVGTATETVRQGAAGWDVIVMDPDLPDADGLFTLQVISALSSVPIIVTTSGKSAHLLGEGANDCLPKPCSTAELAARIEALLTDVRADAVVNVGELRVEPATRQALLGNRELDLTRREFELLACLASSASTVVTRRTLLSTVWSDSQLRHEKAIDKCLSSLRRKLGETPSGPQYLRTCRGIGLKLAIPA
ncbi:response regulator transcription factor [Amycolatopsis sp. NPDC059090]|uniref:response regulator transcription factor n=1 Tax=unclassified Amycolatopsis TaxID=2618356 RepID=UPI00366D39F4